MSNTFTHLSQPAVRLLHLAASSLEGLNKTPTAGTAQNLDFQLLWRQRELRPDLERISPALYRPLKRAGVTGSFLDRCRGSHLRCRSSNQLLLGLTEEVVRTFTKKNIDALLLKGLSLQQYYPAGHRPIGDLDIMVPVARWDEAARLLLDCGWKNVEPVSKDNLTAKHSVAFRDNNGVEVDLHWALSGRLLEYQNRSASAQPFFDNASSTKVGATTCLRLSPADLLLHLLVHGAWIESRAPLRWILDAVHLLDREPGLDWDRLVAAAIQYRVTLQTVTALNTLERTFPGLVPDRATAELAAARTGIEQRLLWKLDSNRASNQYALDLQRTLRQHLSLHRELPLWRSLLLYPLALSEQDLLVSPWRWVTRVRERRRARQPVGPKRHKVRRRDQE